MPAQKSLETMTSLPALAHRGSHVSAAPDQTRLAIYGGPRAVTARYREKWRQIPKRAMLRIAKRMWDDINTHDGRAAEVLEFEQQFADLSGTQFSLLMNSGTAALHSAYIALGVGPGDEVIVPSYTFFASVAPILQCGGTPVFCEIDPRTLTADSDDVASRITPRTRAICVVHVWGNPAEMDRLRKIADDAKVGLIEDCSHAHGAAFRGRPVGSWGDVGCFSLQGMKAVSGGEAGVAVTSDATLYDRMLAIGHFPRPARDQRAGTVDIGPYSLGLKYRPHLYAAILAQESLKRLPELNRRRQRNLEILCEELSDCPAVHPIACLDGAQRGGFLSFLFRYEAAYAGGWNVGAFCQALHAEGAPLNVDRYVPLHTRAPFTSCDLSQFGGALRSVEWSATPSLPITEATCPALVSFPAFTDVQEPFVRQCAQAVRKVAHLATKMTDFRYGT